MTTAAAGRLVGSWELEEEIGRGGQAVVYRARHATLGRPAAVKLVRRSVWADPAFRVRFERECDALGAMAHPHVIPVLDAGEDGGRGYLAMRLADRGSLAARLRDGALDPERAVGLIAAVASALDALHAAGRVHRDVTPANILIDSGAGPWLGDFGLARRIDATAATSDGLLIGTAGYLAPEVIEGRRAAPASDRYALAAVAFHALTGRAPHVAPDVAAVLYGHLHRRPPSVGEIRPDLPAALDEVFARALARRPQDRPSTAAGFVAELRRALSPAGADASVPPPSPTAILPVAPAPADARPTTVLPRRKRRRGRAVVAAAAIITLAGAVGAGGATLYTMRDALPLLGEAPVAIAEATTVPGPDGVEVPAGALQPSDLLEGVPGEGGIAATVGDVRVVSLPGGVAALDPSRRAADELGLSGAPVTVDGRRVGTLAMTRWGFFFGGSAWGFVAIREPAGERGLVVSGDHRAVRDYIEALGASIGARILPGA